MPEPDDQPPQETVSTPLGSWSWVAPVQSGFTEHWAGAGFIPGSTWPAGHVLLDDFEVEGVLGQGGMGVVYRVRQRSTDQHLAVKRARLTDAGHRRRFLAELQLWIDLPAHPHLTACRFFRTIADEVVIFMDLADGGSLADRITQRRLDRIEILDVAIQVGDGLHALHECGLVHQDVKPANVLMTAGGAARISDFGLARARARVVQPGSNQPGQSILISSGAMTPAYCSPEQAARRPLSRRTDVWSWGVLVLEMFVGRVPCCERGGHTAADVLSQHLEKQDQTNPGERMQVGLVSCLQRCLAEDQAERWSTLADAVEVLLQLYRDEAGHAYPRSRPGPVAVPAAGGRSAVGSGQWDPPRKWLKLAFQEAGRDPTEIEAILPPPAATARAQAVADLSAYDEARQILQRLIDSGRSDLEHRIPELCLQKALVHLSAGDSPGALELFDLAIMAWQQLIHGWRRHELTPNLVGAYLHKASALRILGENERAIELCDKVIRLWQGLTNRRARRDLRDDLAGAYLQKGLALRNLGKPRDASDLFDRAIELWQQLAGAEDQVTGWPSLGEAGAANDLAQAYLSKANVLAARGEPVPALELCERAIRIRQRLARTGTPSQQADLARALLSKATVLRAHDRAGQALPLYDQAIASWQRLVHELGLDELSHELARAWLSRANADRTLGEARQAADGCARAAAIWERLVRQEGRRELTLHLARAYLHQSNALRVCGDLGEAVRCADLGIALWEQLVCVEERADLGNDLARAYLGKGKLMRQLGKCQQALEMYDQALALRRRLVDETGREDIEGDLARDAVGRAEILVEMGDREKGRDEMAAAVAALEELVRRTRRKDLEGAMLRARKLLLELTPEGGE